MISCLKYRESFKLSRKNDNQNGKKKGYFFSGTKLHESFRITRKFETVGRDFQVAVSNLPSRKRITRMTKRSMENKIKIEKF